MKKILYFCLFLAMMNFCIFAESSVTFKNPGDARVFHENGRPFRSESRAGKNGIVPDTTLIQGDAIKTGKSSIAFNIGNTTVTLGKNSLLALYRLNGDNSTLYLLEGQASAVSRNTYTSNSSEFIILTPVSRFSCTPPFNFTIKSTDETESMTVLKGAAVAYNYVTKENVSLESGEYIDFLEENTPEDYELKASEIGTDKAREKLDIKDSVASKISEVGGSIKDGAKKGWQVITDAGKNAAEYISQQVKPKETEKEEPKAEEPAKKEEEKPEETAKPEVVEPKEEKKPNYVIDDTAFWNRIEEKYKPMSDKPTQLTDSTPAGSHESKATSKAEEKPVEKKAEAAVNDKPEITETAVSREVIPVRIESEKPADEPAKTEQAPAENKIAVNVTSRPAEDYDENAEIIILNGPNGKMVSAAPVNNESKSYSSASNTPDDNTSEPTEGKPAKTEKHKVDGGVELGVTSVFNKENMNDFSKVTLFANPYIKSDDFELKLGLDFDYGKELDGTYSFSMPQINFLKNSDYLPPVQKYITFVTQFIRDLRVGDFLYISRNLDLPIEYNNLNLRKHTARDNEYMEHSYLLEEEPVYNPNSIVKKIPFLLNVDTKYVKIRAFTDDLDNLNKYKWGDYGTGNWRRDDAALHQAEIGFDTKYVGFNIGSFLLKGPRIGNEAADDIFLTARANANITDDIDVTVSTALPMTKHVTTYESGSTTSKADGFFKDISKTWNAGVSFNIRKDNIVFNVGADFNKGKLITGILNRQDVFDSVLKESSDYISLYTDGFDPGFAVYPYINVDFDWDAFGLTLNADMPIFFNTPDDNVGNRLKSWANGDFLYRLNGNAKFKFSISDVMKLTADLSLDDVFPLRGSMLSGNAFNDYLKNISGFEWTGWNLFPRIGFEISDGPILLKMSVAHQRIKSDLVSGITGIFKEFNPTISFLASVKLGSDYLFNGDYIKNRTESEIKAEKQFNIVFNANVQFNSAKWSYDTWEEKGDGNYIALTITPFVGVRHKNFTVIAKFDIENFNIPQNFSKAGDIVDTFLEEINIFNILNISRKSGITEGRRSALYEPQFIKTLTTNVSVGHILDLNIADLKSFINGFVADSKSTYFDLSLGWMKESKFYINYIVPELSWGDSFKMDGKLSLNADLIFGNFFFGINAATTMGADSGFKFGLSGDISTWDCLLNLGFGYANPGVFDLALRLGVQNGNLGYNMFDYLTQSSNGKFMNQFKMYDNTGAIYNRFSQFVDLEANINISNNMKLSLNYDLPMALFDSESKGLLTDRFSAKFSLTTSIIDVYAVFAKRALFAGIGDRTWKFSDIDNMAFKAGLDFKADYATLSVGIESAHFIYGAFSKEHETSIKDFSINVGIKFGFI